VPVVCARPVVLTAIAAVLAYMLIDGALLGTLVFLPSLFYRIDIAAGEGG
jgi:hypothetical protein